MEEKNTIVNQEFAQIHDIINLSRSRAFQAVKLAAWKIGAYMSASLKNSAWGSKTVKQLSEYLRSQDLTLREYTPKFGIFIPLGMRRLVALYHVNYAWHPVRDASLTGCERAVPSFFLPSDIFLTEYGSKNHIITQK